MYSALNRNMHTDSRHPHLLCSLRVCRLLSCCRSSAACCASSVSPLDGWSGNSFKNSLRDSVLSVVQSKSSLDSEKSDEIRTNNGLAFASTRFQFQITVLKTSGMSIFFSRTVSAYQICSVELVFQLWWTGLEYNQSSSNTHLLLLHSPAISLGFTIFG